jgi:hypothetical protein
MGLEDAVIKTDHYLDYTLPPQCVMPLFPLSSEHLFLDTCMFVKQAATCGMNVTNEYYNCKSRLNLPYMCIYCGSKDDEPVLDTESSSEGKNLRPRCQSYVESRKPRVAYGKRAFDKGTGQNIRQRDIGGVGDHDGEEKCDSNTNDDEEEENDDYDNDEDDDGECVAIYKI